MKSNVVFVIVIRIFFFTYRSLGKVKLVVGNIHEKNPW